MAEVAARLKWPVTKYADFLHDVIHSTGESAFQPLLVLLVALPASGGNLIRIADRPENPGIPDARPASSPATQPEQNQRCWHALDNLLRFGRLLAANETADLLAFADSLPRQAPRLRKLWRTRLRPFLSQELPRHRLVSLLPAVLMSRLLYLWFAPAEMALIQRGGETLARSSGYGPARVRQLSLNIALEQRHHSKHHRWSPSHFLLTLAQHLLTENRTDADGARDVVGVLAAAEMVITGTSASDKKRQASQSGNLLLHKALLQARHSAALATLPERPMSAEQIQPVPELPGGLTFQVENGGLVLLWPFISRYFDMTGITQDGEFMSEPDRSRAVFLLQYLASGVWDDSPPEQSLILNKLLCGMPLTTVPCFVSAPDEETRRTGDGILQAVIQHWRALGETSLAGLRETFLMRTGQLVAEEEKYTLKMFPGPFDMLLDSLPWSVSLIKLSSMSQPLYVQWRA